MGQKQYLGNTDLLLVIQLIHSELEKYVKAVEGKSLSDENFTSELKTKLSNLDTSLYATLASPALTGKPTAPTATVGSSDTQIATTAFVTSSIASALLSMTGIKFQKVTSFDALPEVGANGTIYFIPNSGANPNASDEYFWDGEKYELFGTTQISLAGYLQETDLVEISADDVQAAWDSVFGS